MKSAGYFLSLSCFVLGLVAGEVYAADGTWTSDADGNWSDMGNWSGGIVADGADFTATFGDVITANRIVTLDSPRTIGNVLAADTGQNYTIQNNILTFAVSSGTPAIDVPSGRILTISSVISGNNGLAKTGAGRLYTTGNNTFTGGLVINAGIVGDNSAPVTTEALNNNLVTVNSDATLVFKSGATTTNGVVLNNESVLTTGNNNGSITINGPVTGSGGLKIIKIGDGSNTIYLNSTGNTFTGGVEFASGRGINLLFNSFVDSGAPGSGNIVFSTGRAAKEHWFTLNSGFNAPLVLNNRQFAVTDTGDDASNESIGIRNNSSQDLTINTDLIVSGSGAKRFILGGTGSGTNTFAGSMPDGSACINLIKNDSCTWILSGENTYTGTTTVANGPLVLQGEQCLPDEGILDITGGTVQLDDREAVGALQFSGVVTNSGTWGSSASGAENINDTYFSGTARLYVGIGFPPGGTVLVIK